MTEIEKMYKLAKVKAINIAEYGSTYIPKSVKIDDELYPSFTAEKQLELIKWLAKIYELSINWDKQYNNYRFTIRNHKSGLLNHSVCYYKAPFEETLAFLINMIWQDLTDQEKEEIRNILNEK